MRRHIAQSMTVKLFVVCLYAALTAALTPLGLPHTGELRRFGTLQLAMKPRARPLSLQDRNSDADSSTDGAAGAEPTPPPSSPPPPPLDLNAAFAARLGEEGGSVGLKADKLRDDLAKVMSIALISHSSSARESKNPVPLSRRPCLCTGQRSVAQGAPFRPEAMPSILLLGHGTGTLGHTGCRWSCARSCTEEAQAKDILRRPALGRN